MKVHLVHDGGVVPAGSHDLPPLVGFGISQAESSLTSWVISALTGLRSAVAGTIVLVFTPVPNTPRTSNEMDPYRTTPNHIMGQIAQVLSGKLVEEMVEEGWTVFDVVEPENSQPAMSTNNVEGSPVREF